jgi:DEAD/DEAH box helicase domain-containing protein
VIDQRPLDLPAREYRTKALWLVRPPSDEPPSLGALHAAEHLLTAALPLAAPCDPGDLLGLSADEHPDTGSPTIVIHESRAGGAGIVRAAFGELATVARAARAIAEDCPCDDGCPSCVQSFSCAWLNEPLDKAGAITLLAELEG